MAVVDKTSKLIRFIYEMVRFGRELSGCMWMSLEMKQLKTVTYYFSDKSDTTTANSDLEN